MKTILLIALLFIGVGQVSGQVLKTIGGAAKSKVEQQDFNTTRNNKDKNGLQNKRATKVNPNAAPETSPEGAPAPASEEVDTTVVEPANSDAMTEEAEAAAANANAMASGTGGAGKYKTEYTFDGKMAYEIEDLKKAKKNTMAFNYSEKAMWMQNGTDNNSTSIMDYENEVMIMFDEKAKTAMVMSMAWSNKMAGQMADKNAEKTGKTTVTKTGKTKTILGYNCTEYLATSEDGSKTDFWISTETGVDNSVIGGSITKNMKTPMPEGEYGAGGVMMEFTSYNKKGESETHMIMTELTKTAVTKSTTGYTVTDMSSH